MYFCLNALHNITKWLFRTTLRFGKSFIVFERENTQDHLTIDWYKKIPTFIIVLYRLLFFWMIFYPLSDVSGWFNIKTSNFGVIFKKKKYFNFSYCFIIKICLYYRFTWNWTFTKGVTSSCYQLVRVGVCYCYTSMFLSFLFFPLIVYVF